MPAGEAAAANAPRAPGSWRVGERVADTYEVRAVLGEGGMGVVYRVRHLGWDTDLAVKSPLAPGMRDGAARDRFIREAETWVGFGPHPHVCTCHYLRTLDGVPRLFVEYLDAGSLAGWIANGRLYEGTSREATLRVLDVAIQAAWGLIHAHDQGVVHQDVKPANILLDSAGRVKITDFGLARAQPPAVLGPATGDGAVAGPPADGPHTLRVSHGGMTRAYASPEQYTRSTVGRRSDVWSFAVSLVEMLVGDITWQAGPAVGAVLAALRADGFRAGATGVEVPAALDGLLASCLRGDPAERPDMRRVAAELTELYEALAGHRYPRSLPRPGDLRADELNNRALSLLDLGRADEAGALLDEACAADPQHPEAVYNRGLLRWRAAATTDEQLLAELESVAANSVEPRRVAHLLARVHLERGDAEAAAPLIESPDGPDASSATEDLRRHLAQARAAGAAGTRVLGRIEHDGEGGRRPGVTADGRYAWTSRLGQHTVAGWELPAGRRLPDLAGHTDTVYALAVAPDGRRALSASLDGTVRVWDTSDGRCLRVLTGHGSDRRAPGAGTLPVGQAIRVAPARSGDRAAEPNVNRSVYAACWVPGRATALSAGVDDTVREWDPETGSCLRVLTMDPREAPPLPDDFVPFGRVGASTHELCVTDDGRLILCSRGGLIWVWDDATGEVRHILAGHTNSVTALSAPPDGRRALSASIDGTVRVWDLATGRALRTLRGAGGTVTSVRAVLDGRHAVSLDRAARVWELATGRCLRTVTPASAVGVDPDGLRLPHLTPSGEVRAAAWRSFVAGSFQIARPRDLRHLLESDAEVAALVERAHAAIEAGDAAGALAPLRQARATPGHERAAPVLAAWRGLHAYGTRAALRTAREETVIDAFRVQVDSVALTPDGTGVVCGTNDGRVQLRALSDGRLVRELGEVRGVASAVEVTPDGTCVVAAGHGEVSVWETSSGRLRHTLRHPARIGSLHVLPAGGRLVTSDADRTVRVWEVAGGTCETAFAFPGDEDFRWAEVLCLTPDGRRAVVAHRGCAAGLWDLASGVCLGRFGPGERPAVCALATADGRWLVTAADDGALSVRDLATGALAHTLTGHDGRVYQLSATADGRHLASASWDGTVRLWDLTTGRCLRVLTGHTGWVTSVGVSGDGTRVVSGGSDDTLRVWELDWDLRVRDLTDWRDELRPRLEVFLARSGNADDAEGRDLDPLRRELAACGYRGVPEPELRNELSDLARAIHAVDPARLRPQDVTPERAAILSDLADEHAARGRHAAAVETTTRALAILRALAETAPETGRTPLIRCLQKHAVWLARLRRTDEALAWNEEAVRLCRGADEPARAVLLAPLMYNHWTFLRRAKRRAETEDWGREIHRAFIATAYASHLPGVASPLEPVDDARTRRDLAAVREALARYSTLPADHPQRLPGLAVAHAARTRLLVRLGELTEAGLGVSRLVVAWLGWMRALKRSGENQCLALAVGVELLDVAEPLGGRMFRSGVRRALGLTRRATR
ncbi:protein kinase [Streptomyces sp. 3MP-14]|uniref:Protein kinase n=1 Tax=Streptomyces mimosae TaxID=2586635 RepID=A0A5N5ZZL5_9ACTN|nr:MULTISPECIES: serine/threonine-protein kinase [Streptomyces]KAB8161219.1 protein kinase [Streptomyces mimosae]KAB8179030.1 protein kinase [Streptomyces sp. 3MP-14]